MAGPMTDLTGKPASLIPTPALVVETGALERNLRLMSGFFGRSYGKLRPHFKSNKCVTIAKRQLECGNAAGITCAKLSEAEVLASSGIQDVLAEGRGHEAAHRSFRPAGPSPQRRRNGDVRYDRPHGRP